MLTAAAVDHWLNTWRSDGIRVQSHELMYYRSKVAAFQRFRRLHPPPSTGGALLSRFKGRGMEFDEFRHYQAGDDVRTIDWRVTARTGTPHTKLFREERERPVFVVVDLSHSMQFGTQLLFKSVQACHLAAVAAWLTVARGDRIGAVIGSQAGHVEVKPQGRDHGAQQVIHQLVTQQHAALELWLSQRQYHNVFSDTVARLQQIARPGSIIYLISDWHSDDPALWRNLLALQRHCQLVPFMITDPMEQQLPAVNGTGMLWLTDGQQQLAVHPGNSQQRKSYAQAQQQWQQNRVQQWRQLGSTLHHFSAGQPIELQWPGEVLR